MSTTVDYVEEFEFEKLKERGDFLIDLYKKAKESNDTALLETLKEEFEKFKVLARSNAYYFTNLSSKEIEENIEKASTPEEKEDALAEKEQKVEYKKNKYYTNNVEKSEDLEEFAKKDSKKGMNFVKRHFKKFALGASIIAALGIGGCALMHHGKKDKAPVEPQTTQEQTTQEQTTEDIIIEDITDGYVPSELPDYEGAGYTVKPTTPEERAQDQYPNGKVTVDDDGNTIIEEPQDPGVDETEPGETETPTEEIIPEDEVKEPEEEDYSPEDNTEENNEDKDKDEEEKNELEEQDPGSSEDKTNTDDIEIEESEDDKTPAQEDTDTEETKPGYTMPEEEKNELIIIDSDSSLDNTNDSLDLIIIEDDTTSINIPVEDDTTSINIPVEDDQATISNEYSIPEEEINTLIIIDTMDNEKVENDANKNKVVEDSTSKKDDTKNNTEEKTSKETKVEEDVIIEVVSDTDENQIIIIDNDETIDMDEAMNWIIEEDDELTATDTDAMVLTLGQ